MSIFGEPLPHEDDTATSLIRRTGYPPEGTYDQMPQAYLCPCCSEFSNAHERDRLVRAAKDEKEAERRRLMQLDVFDERAKPLPSERHRRPPRHPVDEEPLLDNEPAVPPPPPTLDELRRSKRVQNPSAKLIVTVHHGKNLTAEPPNNMSVIVRCGAFEGQTAKVPRGNGVLTTWDELFEFPYPNSEEPLEVLVVRDADPAANNELLGGVVIPPEPLHDRSRGDEESLPVMPEEEMRRAYGRFKEGPLGAVVVSWYVSEDGEERMEETAAEQQTLDNPLGCTFVVHNVFQYTDNGSEPYPGGVLCVLRDTDDNCSESVLYSAGSLREPTLSPYYSKEGYHYLPENPSQIMQLHTEKKLGHILICVPKQDNGLAATEEEEELLVVGAVPLDFDRLYHKGAAVLLIESKSKDDALWGEISLEWANKPATEGQPKPSAIEMQKEALFVTVMRGLDLVRRDHDPVDAAYVSVATGDMEGITVTAPNQEEKDGAHVILWQQEIRFIDIPPEEHELEVQAFENDVPISVGRCALNEEDEGVCIVQMHDLYNDEDERGEIILSYKRFHASPAPAPAIAGLDNMAGEDDEEKEEQDEEAEEAVAAEDAANGLRGAEDADEEQEEAHDDHAEGQDDAAEQHEEGEEHHDDDDGQEQREAGEEEHEEGEEAEKASGASSGDEHAEDGDEHAEDGGEHAEDHHDDDANAYPTEEADEAKDDDANAYPTEEADEAQDDDANAYPTEEADEAKDGDDNAYPTEEADEAKDGDDNAYPTEEADEAKDGDDNAYPTEEADEAEDGDGDDDANRDAAEEGEEHGEGAEEEHAEGGEEGQNAEEDDGSQEHQEGEEGAEDGEQQGDAAEGEEGAEHHDSQHDDEGNGEDDDEQQGKDGADEGEDGEGQHGGSADAGEGQDGAGEGEDGAAGEDSNANEEGQDGAEGEDKAAGEGQEGDEEGADEAAQREPDADEQGAYSGEGDEGAAPGEAPEGAGAEGGRKVHVTLPDEDASAGAPQQTAPAPQQSPQSGKPKARSSSINWKPQRTPGYQQPWYPAGNPESGESHVPFEKRNLTKKSEENIRQLEVRRERLVEESVRRGSTPRGISPRSSEK